MAAPSMVSRSGGSLIVRSVVSGAELYQSSINVPGNGNETGDEDNPDECDSPSVQISDSPTPSSFVLEDEDFGLPQCKIKRSYLCPRCTFYTQNPRVYLYHLKAVHDEKLRVYECSQCIYASKHSQKLQRHITMVHAPGKEFSVVSRRRPAAKSKQPTSLPPVSGQQAARLDEEAEDDPDDPPGSEEEDEPATDVLAKRPIEKFVVCTDEEIASSEAHQNEGGVFLCSVCSFTCRSESLMTRHERIVHLKRKVFRCTRCSYVTNLKSRFTKHVKYHTMPLIKCGQCDFKTAYKWNLDRHHRNHGGPGAFHCSECNFAADIKQSLTVHEMNHHLPYIGAPLPLGAKRRLNVVGGSDCNAATEEDAIDADELELLRLEREGGTPEGTSANVMTQKKTAAISTTAAATTSIKSIVTTTAAAAATPKISAATPTTKTVQTPTPTKRKPLPSLIPLQSSKVPKLTKSPPLTERDLNEDSLKSCPTPSPKDPGPLIIDTDTSSSENEVGKTTPSSVGELKSTAPSKKKTGTVFDKLKEKLATDGQAAGLVCDICGLEARCLSELVLHQEQAHDSAESVDSAVKKTNLSLSASRCPYCRHRCKSSTDLVQHVKTCPKALEIQKAETEAKAQVPLQLMEGNNASQESEGQDNEYADSTEELADPTDLGDCTVVRLSGVETAPGYGSVTAQEENYDQNADPSNITGPSSIKKVFKCPHCSFWASTASRFHVHIVGHLNRKPFECSLCAYRSNWRWDITKHIRLKSARDPSHERARLLMTDETGRRNYSKYNKHLTLMRITENKTDAKQSKAVANGTQGNVMPGSSEPVTMLPAPPKLTRAPAPRISSRTNAVSLLRPPPPLQAASHAILHNSSAKQHQETPPPMPTLKRPGPPPQESESDAKRPNTENKKTVWRCKQCHFRDGDRAVVLAHVKGHYRQSIQEGERLSAAREKQAAEARTSRGREDNEPTASPQEPQQPQSVELTLSQLPNDRKLVPPVLESNGALRCDICKFTCHAASNLAMHSEFHKPHVDAIFKCYFCPYYVQTKEQLLQHMVVHGVSQDEEFVQKTVMIKVTSPVTSPPPATPTTSASGWESPEAPASPLASDENLLTPQTNAVGETPTTPVKSSDTSDGEGTPPGKRYNCSGCPYVTNSKSQYLYHKQFHRPRGSVFKCSICTYNVTRRHLLHQHMKVHGVVSPTKKSPEKVAVVKETRRPEVFRAPEPMEVVAKSPPPPPKPVPPELDTTDLKDIPVCWIFRNERLLKMFKCRYCPHVNLRRANIQEHERMHSDRPARPWESVQPHQRLGCDQCSYTCNNAGVLSSHQKVHAVDYARMCAIVDPGRQDEDQIKELTEKLNLNAPSGGNIIGQVSGVSEGANDDSKCASVFVNGVLITEGSKDSERVLHFCQQCPARFLFAKELHIHSRFHSMKLAHRCRSCSYTARQDSHLQAHFKVHKDEYQVRTKVFLKLFPIHKDYPMPLHACVKEPHRTNPTWVVPSDEVADKTAMALTTTTESNDESFEEDLAESLGKPLKTETNPHAKPSLSCTKCPATFFKPVALHYHLTLHGAGHPHKCRVCDYAVKTYGNLAKHELIHGPRDKLVMKRTTNLQQYANELALAQQSGEAKSSKAKPAKSDDSNQAEEADDLGESCFQGSPDFVYPLYMKNGRLKEKKYKCVKCPSAFEKRDQYRVHTSLHGSNQRYSCNKCDYAVKYYANYVQHMQKHTKCEEAKAAKEDGSSDKGMSVDGSENLDDSEGAQTPDKTPRQSPVSGSPQRSNKSTNRGPLTLSVADRQMMMVMQQRRANRVQTNQNVDKNYWCLHCPYNNSRRDGIDSHMKRHICVSGARNNFTCDYCDYTVPTQHFLREHTKLHFAVDKLPRPDVFMACDKLEIWAGDEEKKRVLIFQDKGDDRFIPPVPVARPEKVETVAVCVNPTTGEVNGSGSGYGRRESESDSVHERKEEEPVPVESDESLTETKPNKSDDAAVEKSQSDESEGSKVSTPPPCLTSGADTNGIASTSGACLLKPYFVDDAAQSPATDPASATDAFAGEANKSSVENS